MIDGQRWKPNQVDDWRNILFDGGGKPRGGAFLMRARNREYHPPMASQKIRAPRAAAFSLQQFLLRPAEFMQAGKTGNDDLPVRFARRARVARNNFANQTPIGFVIGDFLARVEPCMVKKLPRRPRQRKTPVRVIWLWFAPAKTRFARRRIELIFPDQFIGEGETVAFKVKSPQNFSGRKSCVHANRAWKEVRGALPN